MNYTDGKQKLLALHKQMVALRKKAGAVRAGMEPQPVSDYAFHTTAGEVTLAALFGRHKDLIMIHNMGASCPYCTLWADGYNGLYDHLADRASFVVSSPDKPASQTAFARKRGWRFPLVSHAGTTFADDMGYRSKTGGYTPGISVFRKARGKIVRVTDTPEGPGDDYCALWHLFDLLPGGPGDWHPKFTY